MKNGQKSSLYGEVSPYSEEIPYSERFSQIHYREYPLYFKIHKIWLSNSILDFNDIQIHPKECCINHIFTNIMKKTMF